MFYLPTPMAVSGIGFLPALFVSLSVRFSARYLKNRCTYRITKLDVEMVHHDSCRKPIYFGVKKSKVNATRHKNKLCGRGFLHPCECWLLTLVHFCDAENEYKWEFVSCAWRHATVVHAPTCGRSCRYFSWRTRRQVAVTSDVRNAKRSRHSRLRERSAAAICSRNISAAASFTCIHLRRYDKKLWYAVQCLKVSCLLSDNSFSRCTSKGGRRGRTGLGF